MGEGLKWDRRERLGRFRCSLPRASRRLSWPRPGFDKLTSQTTRKHGTMSAYVIGLSQLCEALLYISPACNDFFAQFHYLATNQAAHTSHKKSSTLHIYIIIKLSR